MGRQENQKFKVIFSHFMSSRLGYMKSQGERKVERMNNESEL